MVHHPCRKIEARIREKRDHDEERDRSQYDMFDKPIINTPRCATLEQSFLFFNTANPHIWEEIKRRARLLLRNGAKRIGIKMIYESIRYDYAIHTNGSRPKLNNNYTAFYARKLSELPDMPPGVIELRERHTL